MLINFYISLHLSYTHPLVKCCTPKWSTHTIGLINHIENVRRKFTHFGVQHLTKG